jgi:CheY-like chemotaxis protein
MGKKILLADDSITIQKVIELTFSDEDFDVITVGNGRLALEKVPEVRPDIVLCDIIMPEKDGYEVCEQIKTNPAFSHVPVLLLTGAFEPFDQARAARAGYDGSLAKPFEPETLIAKVKDLLARAPARAAAPPPASPPAVRPATAPSAPAAAGPPPVLPFQRPAPPAFAPPPSPAARVAPTFIPEEPFGGLDTSAFAEAAPEPAPQEEVLAPVTREESATLLSPPAAGLSPADAAATVMFQAGDLPWSEPPAPPASAPPQVATVTARHEPPPVAPTPAPEAGPAFAPPPVEETPVFEEVLEEDLDFGETSFVPERSAEPVAFDTSGAPLFTPPVATLPPVPAADTEAETGAFEPMEAGAPTPLEPEPVLEPEPAFEREAAPAVAPAPALEPEAFEPGPPVLEEEVVAPAGPPPVAPEPREVVPPAPSAAPVAAESFADVAWKPTAPAVPPPPPSEAATVSVPVEMVETIAQRVVAQISDKVVREIAWEVIPDLAEALIKQEIERLKAELQKT